MKSWHLHYCLYNNQISFRTVPKYVPKMGMRNAKILSSQQLNKQTWPSTRPLWWNFWIFIIKFPLWKANSKSEWNSGCLDDRESLSASVFASVFDDYIDVGDRFWRRNVLATTLAVFITNTLYLLTLTSGTNIQKMSPTWKFWHQHPQIVTNIHLSPTFM